MQVAVNASTADETTTPEQEKCSNLHCLLALHHSIPFGHRNPCPFLHLSLQEMLVSAVMLVMHLLNILEEFLFFQYLNILYFAFRIQIKNYIYYFK